MVAGYNRDDCLSAAALRDWLEECRASLIGNGCDIPRPAMPEGSPSEKLGERQQRIAELIARLTADVPADADERTAEQHARWLLAYSLDWHRREEKAVWWEYFRLSDLGADELMDERAALSGLAFVAATGGTAKAPIHRYRFPPQENEFRGGEDLHSRRRPEARRGARHLDCGEVGRDQEAAATAPTFIRKPCLRTQ